MRNKLKFLVTILSFFCCISAIASLDVDSSGDDDPAKPVQHISPDINLYSSISFHENAKDKFAIKSIYPRLEGDKLMDNLNDFNQFVTSLVEEETERFKSQVAENAINIVNMPKNKTSTLYLDYVSAVIHPNKKYIISVRFSMQSYLAGNAHPTHTHRVLNYDITNGSVLSLNNLFRYDSDYLTFLSSYSRYVLSRKLPNKEMVVQGTAPIEENFKNWNLHSDGLLITFDQYQVAPGVYGAQTALIPYPELKSVIDPDALISSCVKSPKKCRSDILTGGFTHTALANTKHRRLNPGLR